MIWVWTLLEGLGLGALLFPYCLIGIRNGAVGMVYLYDKEVQKRCVELGLTTPEKIKKRAMIFKIGGLAFYVAYVLAFVYAVNGARGFTEGFLQTFVILSVCNVIDRIFVDELWVCHTKAWVIPGTEDLAPYIKTKDKVFKWLFGTVGMAIVSVVLAGITALILK